MTLRTHPLARPIGLCLVIAVVLARAWPVLYWADVHFDADQAVMGLMAKHAGEGRALPVFQYALRYVLVLEAWLSVPFVALADGSVALVKVVPVALNVATASLLYWLLSPMTALGPVFALVAAAPFALAGASTTKDLTDALGMNIEPLFFAIALWMLRERPLALGVIAAVAVKNREFALYAIAALLLVDLLRDRSARLWRPRIVTLVAFMVTWSVIEALRLHSSPLGPGTTMAMLSGGGDNMAVATAAMCIDPAWIPPNLWAMATRMLPFQFGIATDPRSVALALGRPPLEAPWLWAPLVAVLLVGLVRGVVRAWRHGATPMTWLGAYLILTGVQAVVVYACTRCGPVSPFTLRYTLLSLFIPIGALVLALERERLWSLRAVTSGVVAIWVAVGVMGHASLVRALADVEGLSGYEQLTQYLEQHDVRFIVADYRAAYHVAFLTGERIKALTTFERVHDYTLAVSANLDRAVEVRRRGEERCEGGATVAGFYICPPRESPHRP